MATKKSKTALQEEQEQRCTEHLSSTECNTFKSITLDKLNELQDEHGPIEITWRLGKVLVNLFNLTLKPNDLVSEIMKEWSDYESRIAHHKMSFKDIKEMLEEKLDVIKISEEIVDLKNGITESAIASNYKSDIPKSQKL